VVWQASGEHRPELWEVAVSESQLAVRGTWRQVGGQSTRQLVGVGDVRMADAGSVRHRDVVNIGLREASDITMIQRAQIRVIGSLLILGIVVTGTAESLWWSVLLLEANMVSLLHANRPYVTKLTGFRPRTSNAGVQRMAERLAALAAWVFRYPDHPHINAVGVWEFAAAAVAAGAVGQFGNLLGEHASLQVVVTLLMVMGFATMLLNVNSHVAWVIDAGLFHGPSRNDNVWKFYRRTRLLHAPALAAVAMGLLWPGHDSPEGQVAAIVGPAAAAGVALVAGRQAARAAEIDRRSAWTVRQTAVRDCGTSLHSGLKAAAKAIIPSLHLIEDERLQSQMWHFVTLAISTERRFGMGLLSTSLDAAALVGDLTMLNDQWARYSGCVRSSLDPTTMSEDDNEFIFALVTNHLANAASAGATGFELALTAEELDDGKHRISLRARCVCGKDLPALLPEFDEQGLPIKPTTLYRLAERIGYAGGHFLVDDDVPGDHTFTASWPTGAVPVAVPVRSANRGSAETEQTVGI
jgi:hypothetical protein